MSAPTEELGRISAWIQENWTSLPFIGHIAPAAALPIGIFIAFFVSGIGLHFSEDFILIPAGYLVAETLDTRNGVLPMWPTLIAGVAGIILGDAGWKWMCGRFGTRLLHTRWLRRFFHPRRLLEVKHQMEKKGAWVLVAARFIPGTRTPVITMCGLLHMPWWKFLLVELVCVPVTVPMQMLIGYATYHALSGIKDSVQFVTVLLAVVAAITIVFVGLHIWLGKKHAKAHHPRASVKWLSTFDTPTTRVR
ncbi:MAG: DedA family protein [Planctomycetota bacterium]|nr:DedA family protein [Planctomycetota bacterium]